MKKDNSLKWLVIGSGDVVKRLMSKSLNLKNKSSVEAILSKNLLEAKLLSNYLNVRKVYTDINQIKDFSKFNWVYIATPPNTHLYYVKKLAPMKLNILCEKPIVSKFSDLNKIITTCQKNKVFLETTYYRRFQERFIFIKKLLQKKILGKIIYFKHSYLHNLENHPTAKIYNKKKTPWRFVKKISGGGNYLDMGPHVIDIISHFIGDIDEVHFYQNNKLNLYDVEENTVLNIKLKNKIIGQSIWSSVSGLYEDKFQIFGAKGYISFSMNSNPKIEIKTKNKHIFRKINFTKPLYKKMIRELIENHYNKKKKKKEFSKILSISKFQLAPYT